MAPTPNGRVIFNDVPEGFPEPGKTTVYDDTHTIDLESVPLNGGFLVKLLNLSIDPFMRGKMRHPSAKSYSAPYTIGQPLSGFGLGVVLRSEFEGAKPGDHVAGFLDHQHYSIKQNLQGLELVENPAKLPWSFFLGVLGMPGKTAYMGWKEHSRAKAGETVFVSGGAGPVGSAVIQLAKLDGLKVIASAGSEEKVQFLRECGADVAFNYKTTSTDEVLEKEGPINIYWDNVGGETLDAAIVAAAPFARFLECGMISGYNSGGAPCKNIGQVVGKSLTIQGFLIFTLEAKYRKEFFEFMGPRVASGQIKHKEDVYEGLEKVGDVLLAVQKGTNKAKAIIHVADD